MGKNMSKTLIRNMKVVFKEFSDPENYNKEKDSYNYISPRNLAYIQSKAIRMFLDGEEEVFTKEALAELSSSYDFEHSYVDKSGFRSKEFMFDNLVNFEFHHHRQIVLEELFCNSKFVVEKLGFNPVYTTPLINWFISRSMIISVKEINELVSEIPQYGNLFSLLTAPLESMREMDEVEIKHHLEDYPLIEIGNFLVLTSPVNFNMNLRRILHFHLKKHQLYIKERGENFENLVFSLIDYHTTSEVYTRVKYGDFESDIALEDDMNVYVFECKAIDLYDDFKRNLDKETIKQNLDAILEESRVQGERFFEYVDDDFTFRTDQGEVKFDKEKTKNIISVSLEQPFGVETTSKHNYLNLSFSDLATVFQIVNTKIYDHNNYDNGLEVVKKMAEQRFDIDNTVNFVIHQTLPLKMQEVMKRNKVDFDVNLSTLNFYDRTMMDMMFELENLEEAVRMLKNREWVSEFVSKEKNISRRTIVADKKEDANNE